MFSFFDKKSGGSPLDSYIYEQTLLDGLLARHFSCFRIRMQNKSALNIHVIYKVRVSSFRYSNI